MLQKYIQTMSEFECKHKEVLHSFTLIQSIKKKPFLSGAILSAKH